MKINHIVYDDEKYYEPLVGYNYGKFDYNQFSGFFVNKYKNIFDNKKIKLEISCFVDLKKLDILFL